MKSNMKSNTKSNAKRNKKETAGKCSHCDGKINYTKERFASKVTTLMWGSDPNESLSSLHAYPCPHSKYYHIGHIRYYEELLERQQQASIYSLETEQ